MRSGIRGGFEERGRSERAAKEWIASEAGYGEGPTENYKLYVVPNRPSKIIPARPRAIMNM